MRLVNRRGTRLLGDNPKPQTPDPNPQILHQGNDILPAGDVPLQQQARARQVPPTSHGGLVSV